jgi:hypothetical protein
VFGLENNNCANKQQYRLKKTKLQVKNNKTVDDQDYFQPNPSTIHLPHLFLIQANFMKKIAVQMSELRMIAIGGVGALPWGYWSGSGRVWKIRSVPANIRAMH